MDNKKNEFYEQGFIVLENFYSSEECLFLEECINQIIEKVNNNPRENGARYTANRADFFDTCGTWDLFHPNLYNKHIVNILGDEDLLKIVRDIIGFDLRLGYANVFWSPLEVDYQLGWHRDLVSDNTHDPSGKPNHVSINIALNRDEAFWTIPKSHKRLLTNEEKLEANIRNSNKHLPGSTNLILNQGDVLLFNSWMLHRGEAEAGGNRRTVHFRIEPMNETFSSYVFKPWMTDQSYVSQLNNNVAKMVHNMNHFIENNPLDLREKMSRLKRYNRDIVVGNGKG